MTTAAEKRVRVAKDVLLRIKSGQYRPATGNWLRAAGPFDPDAPAEEIQCECCALGAVLASAAICSKRGTLGKVFDESEDLGGHLADREHTRLSGLFSTRQAVMIEQAFEGPFGYFCDEEFPMNLNSLAFFGKYEEDPQARLAAIMQNIIDNGGKFVP